MSTTVTIRDVDPDDKSWLQAEARRLGLSMEEYARRILHEKRKAAIKDLTPSEVFRRFFGPENGVDLPPRPKVKAGRPIDFSGPEYAAGGEDEG